MVKIKWGGTVIFGELLVALTVTVLLCALLMLGFSFCKHLKSREPLAHGHLAN